MLRCNSDLSENSCKIKLSSVFGNEAEAFLVNARCRIIDGKENYPYSSILIAVTDKLVGPVLLSVNDYRVMWNSTFTVIPLTKYVTSSGAIINGDCDEMQGDSVGASSRPPVVGTADIALGRGVSRPPGGGLAFSMLRNTKSDRTLPIEVKGTLRDLAEYPMGEEAVISNVKG